jgi:hypothetical protein
MVGKEEENKKRDFHQMATKFAYAYGIFSSISLK